MLYKAVFKRLFDLVAAMVLLPCCLLVFFPIAIAILLEDGVPIFYNALRIGKNGIPFTMYKFRTMMVNSPDIRLADGSTYNSNDDPRVTRIGSLLRRTSLDELPQVLNILLGQMSFIGPRPDPIDWLQRYSVEDRKMLSVLPGITGYNQAYFRNSADGATKMRNDVYYAENISSMLDAKILLQTIRCVLFQKNIYVQQDRPGVPPEKD